MEDLKDRISYGVIRALSFFFERIPLETGLRIGDFLGCVYFFFSKKSPPDP